MPQVVFNGIKSTLKRRLIPDSQFLTAVKLSYQMEIDPIEESSGMLELVDDEHIIPRLRYLLDVDSSVRITEVSVG